MISPCDEYPFGAMIEDLMQGTELESKILDLNLIEKKEIGKNLALFLNELHKIDVVGDKDEEIKINLAKFDKSINKLNEFIANDTKNKLENIRNAYLELMKSKQFCITHGDLNQLNILITDDNKLSGIIDFGNMEYYIPEMEFVHMHSFDRTIYDSMIEHYYKEMNERDILLTELIMNIRHFKNIYNIEERKNMCLLNIERLISSYLD